MFVEYSPTFTFFPPKANISVFVCVDSLYSTGKQKFIT